jgi:hypothetical protein
MYAALELSDAPFDPSRESCIACSRVIRESIILNIVKHLIEFI